VRLSKPARTFSANHDEVAIVVKVGVESVIGPHFPIPPAGRRGRDSAAARARLYHRKARGGHPSRREGERSCHTQQPPSDTYSSHQVNSGGDRFASCPRTPRLQRFACNHHSRMAAWTSAGRLDAALWPSRGPTVTRSRLAPASTSRLRPRLPIEPNHRTETGTALLVLVAFVLAGVCRRPCRREDSRGSCPAENAVRTPAVDLLPQRP
jgi:hypothetical protein